MNTDTQHAIPTGTWAADPVHSTVGFAVDYMAGTFNGTFSRFDAALTDGALKGSAEVASIQVKDPNLEAHLQSPEFFDAERNPELTFESREIKSSGKELTIAGEVTIKGHTEPVEIQAYATDPMPDPFGNERFGLKVETTIDRTRFGITWNNPLPSGDQALSNDVRIIADLQLVKQA